MASSTRERDWKFMRRIEKDLLARLCARINKRSGEILRDDSTGEHEKYLAHYKHLRDSDRIVADCFDDWRRSTLISKLVALQHHGVLKDDEIEQLSDETRQALRALKDL